MGNIFTPRLKLSPFTLQDVPALHRLWTDPGVRRYLWDDVVIPFEQTESVVRESIAEFEQSGIGYWTMRLSAANELIGFAGFRHFGEPARIEILYGLLPEWWGQGIATEAALAMLRHGFETLGLERIYAGADPPNQASFRVMEKTGMRFCERITIDGLEAIYYVLTKESFQNGIANQPQTPNPKP